MPTTITLPRLFVIKAVIEPSMKVRRREVISLLKSKSDTSK